MLNEKLELLYFFVNSQSIKLHGYLESSDVKPCYVNQKLRNGNWDKLA